MFYRCKVPGKDIVTENTNKRSLVSGQVVRLNLNHLSLTTMCSSKILSGALDSFM